MDAPQKIRSTDIGWTHIQKVFGIDTGHGKCNLDCDTIEEPATGETPESVLSELLNDHSIFPASQRHSVIQESVPVCINDSCSYLEEFMTSLFKLTFTKCCETEPDRSSKDHEVSNQFYSALLSIIHDIIDDHAERANHSVKEKQLSYQFQALSKSPNPSLQLPQSLKLPLEPPGMLHIPVLLGLLNSLRDVAGLAISSVSPESDEYHTAWSLVLRSLLEAVTLTGKFDPLTCEHVSAELKFNGMHNMKLPLYLDDAFQEVSCVPDCTIMLRQKRNGLTIVHPVLIGEMKTSYSHASSSDETYTCDSSSSSELTNEDFSCDSSAWAKVKSKTKTKIHRRTRSTSSSETTSSSNDILQHQEGETTSKDSIYNCEKHLMSKLKTQHFIQLVACLKAEVASKCEIVAPTVISKQNRVHGILMVLNRVYVTSLFVETAEDSKWADLFIDNLGGKPNPVWMKILQSSNFELKFEVSKYLDFFNPLHFKALLAYLRIIIWHDQKCVFH